MCTSPTLISVPEQTSSGLDVLGPSQVAGINGAVSRVVN
jgi:hypothetical protein